MSNGCASIEHGLIELLDIIKTAVPRRIIRRIELRDRFHQPPKSHDLAGLLRKWADDVKCRDGRKCVVCGGTKKLHAHHIKPKKLYPDMALDINNGMTLCSVCHALEHGNPNSSLAVFPAWEH